MNRGIIQSQKKLLNLSLSRCFLKNQQDMNNKGQTQLLKSYERNYKFHHFSTLIGNIFESKKLLTEGSHGSVAMGRMSLGSSNIVKSYRHIHTQIKEFPKLDNVEPISDQEFEKSMKEILGKLKEVDINLEKKKMKIAVALSGGPDSVGLAILAKRWAEKNGHDIFCIIVNHNIREESEGEAEFVRKHINEKFGIKCLVTSIDWKGNKPRPSKVQVQCRNARYELLDRICKDNGADLLLVGHQRDDLLETFIYRLACTSGIMGLCSISLISCMPEKVPVAKPLLLFPKMRLEATCKSYDIKWIDDPTNSSTTFNRIKIRNNMNELNEYGITPERLMKCLSHMIKLRNLLSENLKDFFEKNVKYDSYYGFIAIHRKMFVKLDMETASKVISFAAQYVFSRERCHLPRSSSARFVVNSIFTEEKKNSFGGCLIVPSNNTIYVIRESHDFAYNVRFKFGDTFTFDERFEFTVDQFISWKEKRKTDRIINEMKAEKKYFKVDGGNSTTHRDTNPDSTLTMKLLLAEEYTTMAHKSRTFKLAFKHIPHFLRFSIPVIHDEFGILAVPHIGYKRDRDVFWKFNFKPNRKPMPMDENQFITPDLIDESL